MWIRLRLPLVSKRIVGYSCNDDGADDQEAHEHAVFLSEIPGLEIVGLPLEGLERSRRLVGKEPSCHHPNPTSWCQVLTNKLND